MKRTLAALTLLAFSLSSQLAHAAAISGKMAENFDYAAGTQFPDTGGTPIGGAGWNAAGDGSANTSGWGTGFNNSGTAVRRTATSAGLSPTYNAGGAPTGYYPASGNKLSLDAATGNASQGVARFLGGQTIDSGTTYFSLLLQKTVDSNRSMNWAFFSGASNAAGTERITIAQVGAAVSGVATGSNGKICLIFANVNPTNIRASTVDMGLNVTHLVVGRIDWNASGNETVTYWVDPTNVTTEASALPQQAYTGAEFELTSIDRVRPFAGNTVTATPPLPAVNGDYDEFRIGGTWASVTTDPAVAVPEPGCFALFAISGLALGAFRKR